MSRSPQWLAALALLLSPCAASAVRAADDEGVAARLMRLDRDGDGRLSRDELRDERLFRWLDRDGDGLVSPAEAAAWVGEASPGPAAPPAPRPPADAAHPNVVVILADDLGWRGVGAYGCEDIPTPHIDSLARSGVRLTSGYVSCPVCAPTRAGLLTGIYGQRFGFEHNPGPERSADDRFGLPAEVPTIAERFRAMGWATGMSGKWHLGYRAGSTPTARGFDEFFGFLGGAHAYLPGGRGRDAAILRGREPADEPGYLTDAIAREAVAFVRRHRGEPFFLYVPFNAVHSPMQADAARLARFASVPDPLRRTHAAMLCALDDAVGAILGEVREAGLEERTLVVFLSDNGGPTRQTTSSNLPLRGFKGQVYEGGVRVPFVLSWKGRLPAGLVYDGPVISLDVLPTALAAAGAPVSGAERLDGVDLLPWLTGAREGVPHEALFWRYGRQRAMREGSHKLVRTDDGGPELYDLAADPSESRDLAAEQPARVASMLERYAAWEAGLVPAKWGGRAGRR